MSVPPTWLIRRRFEPPAPRPLPKFATHTLSLPSTESPHGLVVPPPVKGARAATSPLERISAIEPPAPSTSLPPLGQGTFTIWELATHMLPLLSLAIAIGRSKTPLTWRTSSLPMMATELLLLPVTHAKPRWSMAMPNGLESPSRFWGMLRARRGSPFGYTVTLLLPQLAIQILPCWSETTPWGHDLAGGEARLGRQGDAIRVEQRDAVVLGPLRRGGADRRGEAEVADPEVAGGIEADAVAGARDSATPIGGPGEGLACRREPEQQLTVAGIDGRIVRATCGRFCCRPTRGPRRTSGRSRAGWRRRQPPCWRAS